MTNHPSIHPVSGHLTLANYWDHLTARLGYRRESHRVDPGLYSLGNPSSKSPVFVSANYTLGFDVLRSALKDFDCYILVLDTKGINVWCAAGKGTFSTDELINWIKRSGLASVVDHRTVIVPQLGAPGVSAHEVKKRSGFRVEYGPVRANDLPEYLKNQRATGEMRRVKFTLLDRLTLVPVEVVHLIIPTLIISVLCYLIGGFLLAVGAAAAIFAGIVLFPILLPWIPTSNFSTKGFVLGGLVALPLVVMQIAGGGDILGWQRAGWAIAYMLFLPPGTAFLALNFTGSTTFTSRSGVRREIFTYVPAMAWMFGGGLVISITLLILQKIVI